MLMLLLLSIIFINCTPIIDAQGEECRDEEVSERLRNSYRALKSADNNLRTLLVKYSYN
jgi:hypothetical protein